MSEDKTRVGRYEIIRKIGEGGFGIVFEARDTVLDRTVAIKQLRAELSQIPEYLELFKREFRLMTNLSHPNINRLFDTFEEDGRYYIVMDYMPNGSLADKLKDGKSLSLTQTVDILKPLAKALDYAHSKNLIHRDVKPSNILFTESGEPMLSDFGLVKNVGSGISSTTTLALGTPDYMAPEQILAKELTPAVDIYALGVVAFQMLTGKTPFLGNTPYEIQDGHVRGETPDIGGIDPSLPQGCTAIFHKVLAKKSEERFNSVKEFVQKLDEQIGHENQAKYQDKLNLAETLMRQQDFHSAAILLEELFQSTQDEEVKEKLQECKRLRVVHEEDMVFDEELVKVPHPLIKPVKQEDPYQLESIRNQETRKPLYDLVQDLILPLSISLIGARYLVVLLSQDHLVSLQYLYFYYIVYSLVIIGGIIDYVTKKPMIRLITLSIFFSVFLRTGILSLNGGPIIAGIPAILLLICLAIRKRILSSIVIAISSVFIMVFSVKSGFDLLRLGISLPFFLSSFYSLIIEIKSRQ